MQSHRLLALLAFFIALPGIAAAPKLPGIAAAMQSMIDKNEIAGAVTVVVSGKKVVHLDCAGFADVASKRPMTPDTLFWVASMTKPITGAAILMLQDEGKLKVTDLVSKYLPEFAGLRAPSGKPAQLTLIHLLTHTSGLGEAAGELPRADFSQASLMRLMAGIEMRG